LNGYSSSYSSISSFPSAVTSTKPLLKFSNNCRFTDKYSSLTLESKGDFDRKMTKKDYENFMKFTNEVENEKLLIK